MKKTERGEVGESAADWRQHELAIILRLGDIVRYVADE